MVSGYLFVEASRRDPVQPREVPVEHCPRTTQSMPSIAWEVTANAAAGLFLALIEHRLTVQGCSRK